GIFTARLGLRGPSPAKPEGPHCRRKLLARFTGLPECVGERRAVQRAREAPVVRAHVGAAAFGGAPRVRDHDAVAPADESHERLLGPHPPAPETRAPRLPLHAGALVSSEAPVRSDAGAWAATHSTAAAWIRAARSAGGRPSLAARSASTSDSLLISMRMPVSLAASRAFWPFLPIASESWLSGTMTSVDGWPSGSLGAVITTDDTFAGDSARAT